MDEGLLNDLLECSVCLERLDTSSRVLPCQHTFCLKCLKVIVESHKELRCPECRILVETKVEELPPNVLLMRILEGMKSCSAPKKLASTSRIQKSGGYTQVQSHQNIQQSMRGDGKQLPPHGRAMYDYMSKELGDLSFKKGEIIILQKKLDSFWYQGECSGRSGIFPITFVQVVVALPVPPALCKALYDFRMSAPDEEGCLAFDKGAIITVHRRVDENWAEGRLDQRVGIFPIAFVELNQAARQLINSTPLNRPVPPLPDHTRQPHSDHRQHSQHNHRYQPMSTSTPSTGQGNYQNMSNMSHSQPNYHGVQPMLAQSQMVATQPPINPHSITTITQGGLISTTAVPRNILDPTQTKHSVDLIHFTNKTSQQGTMGLQSVSRISDNLERLRTVKYENYNLTPIHKMDTTYQNVRSHEHFPVTIATFNNISSDSSSSQNTPSVGVSSTTTPNTSSNTSTCESAEPSLPSSPDNNTDKNQTVIANTQSDERAHVNEDPLNASLGTLSINESSTATNTSLNVNLPPSESPKSNPITSSNCNQTQSDLHEGGNNVESVRMDTPSSSKVVRSSGPESMLNFGMGLQAALSPSHGKDGYLRNHREHHHREKRNSLTPSSHLQSGHTQNRHSAEILATSLLDHTPERDRDRERPERDRDRRRRRSRSNERPLPASYVALYPYKPQKPDELELKKGGVYTVTERCRDGWYKGWSERSQRGGVFPGNYVAPHYRKHDKNAVNPSSAAVKVTQAAVPSPTTLLAPPDAPPRAQSPNTTQPLSFPWSGAQPQQGTPKIDKSKERSKLEKASMSSGVSLMKRLAAMKKCKSPPPTGYSMDNPVFEDGPGTSLMLGLQEQQHPVHVRSGSCPSQLLRIPPTTDRLRHKEHAVSAHEHHVVHSPRPSAENPWQSQHRKSQSLDVTASTRRDKHHTQSVKERFRCIAPYPPNSEYELELKVDDIVIVSKKRGDGWYKGTLQRTGRTGLFPASFVQSYPQE